MGENTVFATIQLSRLERKMEVALLADLQEVCMAEERRAFGLSYECRTDSIKKITKVLIKYEKLGMELVHWREGETYVWTIRPWTGFSRVLSNGQYQVRRLGRLNLYNSKREWQADLPMHSEKPLSQFA